MKFGTVAMVRFPRRVPPGREQEGIRPCIVLSNPDDTGRARFPALIVAPLTSSTGPWVAQGGALYPVLEPRAGGLPARSVALLDQVQSVDAYRIESRAGQLSADELAPIRAGLRSLFADAFEGV